VTTNQVFAVPYYSWNGRPRYAVVLLPRDYWPAADNEPLPCIVQAHGRGSSPLSPASKWRDLPTRFGFMVICPDSSGRRDQYNSWAVPGQVADIVEMVDVVESSLPWVHADHQRLYLMGVSMGGQETLAALARYPDRFAAGICVDGTANLAARYRELPLVDRAELQPVMRREVGGTPAQVLHLYRWRSSTPFAATLGTAGVPIAIWWSKEDPVSINQRTTQTGYLYRRIKRLWPQAPVVEVVGTGGHGEMFSAHPEATVDFFRPDGVWRTRPPAPSAWDYASWLPAAETWGYRFTTVSGLTQIWRVHVDGDTVVVTAPARLRVDVPYDASRPSPAVVTINGVAQEIWPSDGMITLRFPPGRSTAVVGS
jgi:hypothetical protein